MGKILLFVAEMYTFRIIEIYQSGKAREKKHHVFLWKGGRQFDCGCHKVLYHFIDK